MSRSYGAISRLKFTISFLVIIWVVTQRFSPKQVLRGVPNNSHEEQRKQYIAGRNFQIISRNDYPLCNHIYVKLAMTRFYVESYKLMKQLRQPHIADSLFLSSHFQRIKEIPLSTGDNVGVGGMGG